MFCPNCSQSFRAGEARCPTCGVWLGVSISARVANAELTPEVAVSEDDSSPMDVGVRRGVKLMLIAVACLPIFKVLAWLYPQKDFLFPGTNGVELFEQAGQTIILLLFFAGLFRAIYAILFERKRDTSAVGQ